MAEKRNVRGRVAPSVNPQGVSPDAEAPTAPKSDLEQRAKKRNTK
jgi:small acid-soluble spore protein L (minor)